MNPPTDNVRLTGNTAALLALVPQLTEPTSQRELATQLGCSTMTVTRAVARLRAAGLLLVQRRDAGYAAHRPDELQLTPAGTAAVSTVERSSSRGLTPKQQGHAGGGAVVLPPELLHLRSAMRTAGLTAGFGNLYPEVRDELVAKVQQLGVRPLVQAALRATWGAVRHVAAYLRHWRQLRAPRPPACPWHPQQPRQCPTCATERAEAVPMPAWFREQVGRGGLRRGPRLMST